MTRNQLPARTPSHSDILAALRYLVGAPAQGRAACPSIAALDAALRAIYTPTH